MLREECGWREASCSPQDGWAGTEGSWWVAETVRPRGQGVQTAPCGTSSLASVGLCPVNSGPAASHCPSHGPGRPRSAQPRGASPRPRAPSGAGSAGTQSTPAAGARVASAWISREDPDGLGTRHGGSRGCSHHRKGPSRAMPPGTMGVRGLLRPRDWETTGVRRQPAGAQRFTARRARAEQSRCVGLEVPPPAPVCPGRGPGVREVLSSFRPAVLPGGVWTHWGHCLSLLEWEQPPLPALGGPVK